MAVVINTVDTNYFTYNGTRYAKIYQPLKGVVSTEVGIYNAFDTRLQLLNSTPYDEFTVDGFTFLSADLLMVALLPVIYKHVTAGGGVGSVDWGNITGTLSAQLDLGVALSNKSDVGHTHSFASLTSKPTTLAGFGITDAYTETEVDSLLSGKADASHTHLAADITDFASTLAGTTNTTIFTPTLDYHVATKKYVDDNVGGGGGSIGGTIADNQIAVGALTANEIEGSNLLTWDGSDLALTGDIVLTGLTTETRSIQVGHGRTGDGISYLDLVGDATYTDYGARFIRWSTPNGATTLTHRGTGAINITTEEAADIVFNTTNVEAFRISANGNLTTQAVDIVRGAKVVMTLDDSWLRLNPDGDYTSGIYAGSSILRTDGELQVGASGAAFRVQTNGSTDVDGVLKLTNGITNGNPLRIYGSSTGNANINYISLHENNGLTRQAYFGIPSGSNGNLYMYSDVAASMIYIQGSNGVLRGQTPFGYFTIGAENASYCHLRTDTGKFYIADTIVLDATLQSYDSDFIISRTGSATARISIQNGLTEFHQDTQHDGVHARFYNGGRIKRYTTHTSGYLEGSYNTIAANGNYANPIYVIGSSYIPAETTLGNMYGVGFCNSTASFINSTDLGTTPSGWGFYVAADGNARVYLNASGGGQGFFGDKVYADNFLINSDRRKKKKIKPLKVIDNPIIWSEFEMKKAQEKGKLRYGVIAQELRETHPQLVDSDMEGNLTVKYNDLFAHELAKKDKEIDGLKSDVEKQASRIKSLEDKIYLILKSL